MTRTELIETHGTLEEFSRACWAAVPDFISVQEAEVAIRKYQFELIHARFLELIARDEDETSTKHPPASSVSSE